MDPDRLTHDAAADRDGVPNDAAGGSALDSRPEISGESDSRVAMTPDALTMLRKLIPLHGGLMFHQSGGCCDGSSPMCYPAGDFKTGGSDVLLGTFDLSAAEDADAPADGTDPVSADAAEVPFWMSASQFEYWKHTHLTLDVVDGRGSGFSVEAPEGKRFLIRSRLLGQDAA